MNRALALTALCAASFACVPPRVSLPDLPSKEAPSAERFKSWDKLRPLAAQQTTTFQNGQSIGQSLDFVMLAGGFRVYDPEDLVKAVDGASPTATFAKAWAQKRDYNVGVARGGVAVTVGGTAAAIAGMLLTFSSISASSSSSASSGLNGGGLVLMGVGLLALLVSPIVTVVLADRTAMDDRSSAFMLYEKDLRERLALPVEGASLSPGAPPSARLLPSSALRVR